MRMRSFTFAVILILLGGLLTPVFPFTPEGVASPGGSWQNQLAAAQATPPPIEPEDDETATTETVPIDPEEDESTATESEPIDAETEGPILEISEDLGDGGQPDGLPREVQVGGARFLFDRIVPVLVDDLILVAQNDDLTVYAATSDSPWESVYLTMPEGEEGVLARYLPERTDTPDSQCPAEVADFGQLSADDAVYVFAGFESDLTPDVLQEVGTSDGRPVYADPDVAGQFPEVFFDDPSGLLRFVLTIDDGRPPSLAESLAFDGSLFTFVADVTGQIDPATLTKLGCTGPYPVFAVNDGEVEPTVDRFVFAGGQIFQFSGEVAPIEEPTEEPTEQPTEEPTEVPTEEPTEIPTEEPTEAPTVEPTEQPTDVPTEEPTEQPTDQPTDEPTEVPTEEPTEVPTEAPTEQPTEAPTELELPTEEPTDIPTDQPTEEPTVVPTEVPAETEVPSPPTNPTQQPTVQLQPPAVVPTQEPNAPPPAAVTAEPATTCAGEPGAIDARGLPARLPNSFQINGIAYAFAGTEDANDAGELTRIGCIGPFEIASTDAADRSEVLYLRAGGQAQGGDVYRYETAVTFGVEQEITGRPQVIAAEEQEYRLVKVWQRSIYSSTSVILFAEDPEDRSQEIFYAVNVFTSVVGDVIGEYRLSGQDEQPSEDMIAAAEAAGLNPDLTVEGQRYLLVSVYNPVGTTTNGFVTLFSASGEGDAEMLLGRDLRRLELFIYNAIPQPGG